VDADSGGNEREGRSLCLGQRIGCPDEVVGRFVL
jgi:hypothetical protein